MRRAIVFISSALALASALTCDNGWVLYDDSSNTEKSQSCLYFGQTPMVFAEANKYCKAEGAHLLSIGSTNSYGEGGLLDFVLDYVHCDPLTSTCPRYWTGARIAGEQNTNGDAPDVFSWKDDRVGFNKDCPSTANANLNCGTGCSLWGTYDDPTDDSNNDPLSIVYPNLYVRARLSV